MPVRLPMMRAPPWTQMIAGRMAPDAPYTSALMSQSRTFL
jgi:hypothetical protein